MTYASRLITLSAGLEAVTGKPILFLRRHNILGRGGIDGNLVPKICRTLNPSLGGGWVEVNFKEQKRSKQLDISLTVFFIYEMIQQVKDLRMWGRDSL